MFEKIQSDWKPLLEVTIPHYDVVESSQGAGMFPDTWEIFHILRECEAPCTLANAILFFRKGRILDDSEKVKHTGFVRKRKQIMHFLFVSVRAVVKQHAKSIPKSLWKSEKAKRIARGYMIKKNDRVSICHQMLYMEALDELGIDPRPSADR